MLTFPHLKIFVVFSSFPLIISDDSRNRATAVGIHHDDAVDGAQFIKSIIHGEKISDRPGLLLFTAPYKLCDGGCNGSNSNFGMVFPLYIGKKGVKAYKSLYHRDFKKVHLERSNAPFERKTTRPPFTLCPTSICPTITTTAVINTTTLTCPPINLGMCPRHKSTVDTLNGNKNPTNLSSTVMNPSTNPNHSALRSKLQKEPIPYMEYNSNDMIYHR